MSESQNPKTTDTTTKTESESPSSPLPEGLVVSDDGDILNWLGQNYVRQPHRDPLPEELASRDDLLLAYDRMSRGYVTPTTLGLL